ncbi:hypothetical protein GCM10025880_52940 [Methylorubrum aminovorans]|nr:hypothetical protein GCM10025880_52940 [Methylorubrum aminovorans]
MNAVRGHGCRYVQGYLIGMPQPMADLLDGLRKMTPPAEPVVV